MTTRHMIGTTGVAECGHRLGHQPGNEHIAESAAGLLSYAEQYGDEAVCSACIPLAVAALGRRGRADLVPDRFRSTR